MKEKEIINWLLKGDASVRYQTLKNLTETTNSILEPERKKIACEGWGKKLLELQKFDYSWGDGLYAPKWT